MSIDATSRQKRKPTGADAGRPVIAGVHHMVSAGHYLAATAAFEILEAGGNAIDAGVAGGIALGVVQSELVNFAGVAPILVRTAAGETKSIAGLGWWPRAMTATYFKDRHGGEIPHGLARTVVPAAPDAWITALQRFGTMRFGEVASAAIRLARDGFVMYPLMAELLETFEEEYARWPSSAAVYMPNGRAPRVGEKFVQADLADTLQYMADQEAARASQGRDAGLAAARDAFYRGDIARAIAGYHAENGGFLTLEDLAGYSSEVEDALAVDFRGMRIHGCGAWCQGPAMLQIFGMLEASGIAALGHNSADYVHAFVEIIKLAFADRHAFIGDPRFVDVPVERLLSRAHADLRLGRIDPARASANLHAEGGYFDRRLPIAAAPRAEATPPSLDTSYIAVVDRWGNSFSATPSDVSYDTPIIPGTGLAPSSRGSQSWADPDHPSSVRPGKRPRLTPSPALAVGRDGRLIPFGTPGGDVQAQAMAQVLMNLLAFEMSAQQAVEAPRFASYSFPDSFEPHDVYPNRLNIEAGVGEAVARDLAGRGHDVNLWPDLTWRAGSVCLVDSVAGLHAGAADPRRPCYAVGW